MVSLIIWRLTAILLSILLLPFFLILFVLVKLDSKGPFLFKQKRLGKNRRVFTMYKIRTMVEGAEKMKARYRKLNEADGPVFKIREDPRYTRVGRFLSHTGLDELPQLINIIRGEMSFVGPRPLPVAEAKKVPDKFRLRFSVLPGITSPWVVKGAHSISFKEWMESDLEYIKNKSFIYDLKIAVLTVVKMGEWIYES